MAVIFLIYFNINKHRLKLELDKQLYFCLIYSLDLVKLKIFNTYTKTNLVNSFNRAIKSFIRVPIFLVEKFNKTVCLYITCYSVINLNIKIFYLLSLIGKWFDWLERVKQFIWLNLTSTNHCIWFKKSDK